MAELFSDDLFLSRARSPEFWPAISVHMTDRNQDDLIYGAVGRAAVASQQFATSFYKLPFPQGQSKTSFKSIGFTSDKTDLGYTVGSGLHNIRLINRTWRAHRAEKPAYRILEFGCGSGRLLRFACEFGDNIDLAGCDVNPRAVEWLTENFPCRVELLQGYDLSFAGPIDLIYAWSIFSHFSEAEHLKWLATFVGALAPAGIVFATFNPPSLVSRMENDEAFRLALHCRNFDMLKRSLSTGFAFEPFHDPDGAQKHGINPETFGQAYISADYIRSIWAKFADVAEIGTAVPGFQDYVILKKT